MTTFYDSQMDFGLKGFGNQDDKNLIAALIL